MGVVNRIVHSGNAGPHHITVRLEPLDPDDDVSLAPPVRCDRELAAALMDYHVDEDFLDALADRITRRCPHCGGRGYVPWFGGGAAFDVDDCAACAGTGRARWQTPIIPDPVDDHDVCAFRWGVRLEHQCVQLGMHLGVHHCVCGRMRSGDDNSGLWFDGVRQTRAAWAIAGETSRSTSASYTHR